jgi:pyruvate-formate lyase-activating enzyme
LGRLELRLIVRIPIIPGKNDDENNVRATAPFLRTQGHVDSIELIPYNRLAESKYTRLGLCYLLNGLQPPGLERMEEIEEMLSASSWPIRTVWGLRPTPKEGLCYERQREQRRNHSGGTSIS